MLNVVGVTLRRGQNLLLEDVSLQVHPGQRLGLVGANGSGKSSLFAALLNELETDGGEIHMPDFARVAHVAQQSPSGHRSALEFVMDGDTELRELQRALTRATEGGDSAAQHNLFERLESIDAYSAEARAARLLNGLGFGDEEHAKPVETFSGGWRMRLNLAQALMCRSDILLLDEPTNHLDLPAILWLEGWLKRYPGILLLVSHDRDFLDALCTRIAYIEQRQINVYTGNYSDFEQQRAAQLALQEALHKRQQREIRHIQTYVDRFRYKASKARQAQSRLKMLERMTLIAPAHVDSPFDFHFMDANRQPRHLAQLEAITAGYDEPVLTGVNLQISAGDRIGLLGANGAGKSTLVKALADGSTVIAGRRGCSRDTRIGYFAQHQLDQLDPAQSPFDHLRSLEPGAREAELRRFLGSFGFGGERIFDPVAPFSGGEKARLALALIVRQKPNLLLLDEPTNHLDLEMRQALSKALIEYSGALVVISHDRHLLRSVCDELWVVHDGKVERFEQTLDDYPGWLAQQATGRQSKTREELPSTSADPQQPASKRLQRQVEAQRRLQLKPLLSKVQSLERDLAACRNQIEALEHSLADASLYIESSRAAERDALIRERAEATARIELLETQWLEASEALENARANATQNDGYARPR
jgi:ATP-binding cassette subfamily F protein 3